ncbi:MAG: sigma-54 dependent transcriptional regulator [Deltaproteobacteria bacterium]|nr:sigma-54 dependent transcriptional regulator [Deltaproteobacteria bacterium]
MKGRILVVDDDDLVSRQVAIGLGLFGFTTTPVGSVAEALEHLDIASWDVVLTDLNMPGEGGVELCARIAERWPALSVLVMSGDVLVPAVVSAIKAGAYDFVPKPFNLEALALRIQRIVLEQGRVRELGELRAIIGDGPGIGGLLGTSAAMRGVQELVARLVGSDATVLITGESGTGKEIVAKALHTTGRRRGGPFVAINCAALPEPTLESELFGHVRGAFTDARADRDGLFVQAHGGTLMLDEIGELPLGLQAKLLRTLEERTVRPLGGNKEIPIDVRLVAATNRALATEAAAGRFRLDLYYRLKVVSLAIPPLRERGEDVLMFAHHFVARYGAQEGKVVTGFDKAVAERLLHHDWPGNVRELRNCIEHAVALAEGPELTLADLPAELRERDVANPGTPPSTGWVTLEQLERDYIARVLKHTHNNRTQAARILGVDRRTLMRKLNA